MSQKIKVLLVDDHPLVREGLVGDVMEIRSRGKEDHRSGGEDMVVLGAHTFDLMRCFAGDARWCQATALANGKPATREDIHEATEPLGPIRTKISPAPTAKVTLCRTLSGPKSLERSSTETPTAGVSTAVKGLRLEAWLIRGEAWSRSNPGRG